MKKIESKIPKHVNDNAPLYAGGLLFMVVVKLAFLAGGLFVVALQQAKFMALTRNNEQLGKTVVKKAKQKTKPVKQAVKKAEKEIKDKVEA